ncbi:MAG: hypothetical protein WAW85_14945, partial [Gordonia sp. (in: high G+C Gram-positive bacteria)]|uniref:hypothetical protein n=1 Tax=Gordonia sp. (in: high G+C Gram-positive bacteria) TaxID=84139 RepID=UPI003BB79B99
MSSVLNLLGNLVVTEPLAGFLKQLDKIDGVAPATMLAAVPVPGLIGCTLPKGSPIAVTTGASGTDELLILTFSGAIDPPSGITAVVASAAASKGRRQMKPSGKLAVSISGTAKVVDVGGTAQLTFTGVTVTLSPSTILLPGGFGLILPASGVTFNGSKIDFGAVEVVLPPHIPLLGDLAVPATITSDPGGGLKVTASIPDSFIDPSITGSLTWHLGSGFSLADLVPTGIDIAMRYPASAGTPLIDGGPKSSTPMTLRLTGSRSPGDPESFTSARSATSAAPDGLMAVGPGIAPGEPLAGVAVALGTAVCAQAGGGAVPGAAVIGAAGGLVGMVRSGGAVLHGVTVEVANTAGGATASILADVSGAVGVEDMKLPPVTISMDPQRPLRVRWRNIRLNVGGGAAPTVDLTDARGEVVDPGGWHVDSPGSLLDVVGTRSGSGSTWLEVDLRFALDLGPLKVRGATIRATYRSGTFDVSIRGLDATLDIPGLITGTGQVALTTGTAKEAGILLAMRARIVPLDLGAVAVFSMRETAGVRMIYLAFGADLPAPIPLGPSGLGLYSVGGAFGVNAALPPVGNDPLTELRKWKPWDPESVTLRAGGLTLGVGVVIGTLPDAGFMFNARGVLGVSAPDLALRAGLEGRLAANRFRLADVKDIAPGPDDGAGLTFFGGLSVDSGAFCVALEGSYHLPHLVSAHLPVAARFPFENPDQWYFRAGSDDGPNGPTGRPPGPIEATVLPNTPFATTGWAFVMIEGGGVSNPGLLNEGATSNGFTVAVGAGLTKTLGTRGVLWAEINATVVAMIASNPMFFWASAQVNGEFGIGPFSLGLTAALELEVGPDPRLGFNLRMCGEVDLWFKTLSKCITVSAAAGQLALPDPADGDWPFPQISLTDGLGRPLFTPEQLTAAADGKPMAGNIVPVDTEDWQIAPTVWPDTIPLLTFKVAPYCEATSGLGNAPDITGTVSSGRLTYTWRLHSVTINRVDDQAPGVVGEGVCAWQQPVGSSPAAVQSSTQRTLALLTVSSVVGKSAGGNPPREAGD